MNVDVAMEKQIPVFYAQETFKLIKKLESVKHKKIKLFHFVINLKKENV